MLHKHFCKTGFKMEEGTERIKGDEKIKSINEINTGFKKRFGN